MKKTLRAPHICQSQWAKKKVVSLLAVISTVTSQPSFSKRGLVTPSHPLLLKHHTPEPHTCSIHPHISMLFPSPSYHPSILCNNPDHRVSDCFQNIPSITPISIHLQHTICCGAPVTHHTCQIFLSLLSALYCMYSTTVLARLHHTYCRSKPSIARKNNDRKKNCCYK